MREELVRKSKFVSLVLRHEPRAAGVVLDANGWVRVGELLAGAARAGVAISRAELIEIVETNEKRRFALDTTGERIRASQGHSVAVDVELVVALPSPVLFHGTATRFADAIRAQGLRRMARQHVHFSATRETAVEVGRRHGKPVVFAVDAAGMVAAGHVFYLSANGVWLTATVPAKFLREDPAAAGGTRGLEV